MYSWGSLTLLTIVSILAYQYIVAKALGLQVLEMIELACFFTETESSFSN